MTSTERIRKYIEAYEQKNTEELCNIYNENASECLFNNYNAQTRAYAAYKASEYVLAGRTDKCYISFEDKMYYSPER